jgi:hypothetical protein
MLSTLPLSAQSLPDKKEVSEWVRKAQDTNLLKDPNGSPYHFVAKIRYTIANKTLEGKYEVLWASPDRYRVEVRLGDTGETEVILGDKMYVERNTPTMTLPMGIPGNPQPVPGAPEYDSVYKISSVGKGPTRQICASVGKHSSLENEICFDPTNSNVVSRHLRAHDTVLANSISRDLTDYLDLIKCATRSTCPAAMALNQFMRRLKNGSWSRNSVRMCLLPWPTELSGIGVQSQLSNCQTPSRICILRN